MPKRSKAETDILVTVAAGLFATHTRDAKEIANLLNTSERSVHRRKRIYGKKYCRPSTTRVNATLASNLDGVNKKKDGCHRPCQHEPTLSNMEVIVPLQLYRNRRVNVKNAETSHQTQPRQRLSLSLPSTDRNTQHGLQKHCA